MIIEWTKDRVLVIPVMAPSGGVMGSITLLPGCNEIPDHLWAGARGSVKDKLDRGMLKELHTQVKETVKEVSKESIDPKTKKPVTTSAKETVTEVKSKSLKELSASEAEEIVKNTFNLKTLKAWAKIESRDSVRVEIKNQIDHVEKYGEDRKKKASEEEK